MDGAVIKFAMPNKLSVSWRGIDVLLFFALWFACDAIVGYVVDPQQSQKQVIGTDQIEGRHHGHPVLQLIEQNRNSLVVFLLLFLGVVVAASLIEELLFRLFLQGWLEAKLSELDVSGPAASGIAIIAVSLFFAALHGGNKGAIDVDTFFVLFAASTIASLLFFTLGIYYLMAMRKMKLTHCLFGTKQFSRQQLFVIAGCCFLALLFVVGLAAALESIAPNTNTDPIPIFFFSLALGYLYSKTRNLSYCILLHACLNMMSLINAFVSAFA